MLEGVYAGAVIICRHLHEQGSEEQTATAENVYIELTVFDDFLLEIKLIMLVHVVGRLVSWSQDYNIACRAGGAELSLEWLLC